MCTSLAHQCLRTCHIKSVLRLSSKLWTPPPACVTSRRDTFFLQPAMPRGVSVKNRLFLPSLIAASLDTRDKHIVRRATRACTLQLGSDGTQSRSCCPLTDNEPVAINTRAPWPCMLCDRPPNVCGTKSYLTKQPGVGTSPPRRHPPVKQQGA